MIETNLIGAFNMTRAAVPGMVERGFGKVFSISTSLSTMRMPGPAAYGASKAALELTHRVWAKDLKGTGVDINILLPGGASDTGFIPATMRGGAAPVALLPADVIVPAAVWLCTDAVNGLTGERVIAKLWAEGTSPGEALSACLQPHTDELAIM